MISTTITRVDWSTLDEDARTALLRRPSRLVADETSAAVREVMAQVRDGGDDALREFSLRFDGVAPTAFELTSAEIDAAIASLPASLLQAVADAAGRIDAWHRVAAQAPCAFDTAEGVRCERVLRPIRRVGLYVPAGSAPLPSTVLMLGIPARIAGCPEIVLCSPPLRDGSVDPAVLLAARTCGIERVFRLGGAQAIAAMAIGTPSVPRCDKLFGPGNSWVTEAKRQAAAEFEVAIDMPAGPSELLVIADAGADPGFVAADLLSQAEHGPDSQVLLVSNSAELLDGVQAELEQQLPRLPRAQIAAAALTGSRLIQVDSIATAFEISNDYAPEHLLLALREPRAWLERVQAAGSVFMGDWAAEALGDYCSGSNHVLPTGGAARATSGLSVSSFQNAISVQSVDRRGLDAIGATAITLARAEGLEAHARAVERRMEAA